MVVRLEKCDEIIASHLSIILLFFLLFVISLSIQVLWFIELSPYITPFVAFCTCSSPYSTFPTHCPSYSNLAILHFPPFSSHCPIAIAQLIRGHLSTTTNTYRRVLSCLPSSQTRCVFGVLPPSTVSQPVTEQLERGGDWRDRE